MDKPEEKKVDVPAGCPEPLKPVLAGLTEKFGDDLRFSFFADEAMVMVPDPAKIREVIGYLKETPEHDFNYLVDVGGVHDPGAEFEMYVFYNLLSISTARRIRIKTPAIGAMPTVPSVTSIWPGANWHEREAYDMFGIVFEGHPDLRRMFLPETLDFHPLRKEYPLRGDNEKPTW